MEKLKQSFIKKINYFFDFPKISLILLASLALILASLIQQRVGNEVIQSLGKDHAGEVILIIWGGIGLSFVFIYLYILVLYRRTYHVLVYKNEESSGVIKDLNKWILERIEMEDEFNRNFQIQTLLSSLLRISLTNLTLDELLDEVLNQIKSISWIDSKIQGCIYLFDEEREILVMNAYLGLHQSMISSFTENPDNRCLCGEIMGLSKSWLLENTKKRHGIKNNKNPGEVHYFLPIKFGEKRLGVLNLLLSGSNRIDEKEDEFFQSVVDVLAGIIEQRRTDDKLNKTVSTLRTALGGTIQAMALTVEIRDPYTAGHQKRVSNLARAIATEMGLSHDQIEGIRIAGIVHDLGKITVPSEILSKPGMITSIEHSLINTHPQKGFEILSSINFPWPIAQIVLQHHERLDGSGYPAGLKKDQILLEARVLMVADVVEAMASHRPYRPSRGVQLAMDEITKNKGKLYDKKVVESCLRLFLNKGFMFDLSNDEMVYSETEEEINARVVI
jgi:putative nucleotidyltransferase with HDIG domain